MKRTFLKVIAFVCLVSTFTIACSSSSKLKNDATPTLTTSAYEGDKQLPAGKFVNALRINKVDVSRPAQVTMKLENSSKGALRVWEDSNSWGAARWRVFLMRKGHLETFFQNPDQGFTVNWPEFIEIAEGGYIVQKLDLNGGNWCGLGHCSIHSERGFGGKTMNFEPNDTMMVIYDVPVTQEARDNGVWYGVIAATASNEPLRGDSNTPNQLSSVMQRNEASPLPVETSMNSLNITKLEVSRAAQVTLQLENSSKATLRIWKDSNSWGAGHWRVLLLRNGQLETFFQIASEIFTGNRPTFNEIPPGSRLEQRLDLNGGNWCGLGHCTRFDQHGFGGKTMTFEANDTVIVIYDVPSTQEARDNAVWYGVVAATTTVQ